MSTAETPLLARAHLELIAAQLRAARAAGMAAVEAANAGLLALSPILGPPAASATAGPSSAAGAPVSPRRPLTKEEIRCFGGQTIAPPGASGAAPAAPEAAPAVTPPAANSSD